MSKIEKAVQQMELWANNPAHGYDQIYRWGEYGDYDCSSSIIQALENSGIPAKSNGATYTGNMYNVLIAIGFQDVTDKVDMKNGLGIIRGDILLNHVDHVAMSCGNGKLVQASINELGTTTGGQPGDQTGTEFYIRDYYNYPWNCILRYVEPSNGTKNDVKTVPVNGKGTDSSGDVVECAGRITKDTICRTGIGDDAPQATLFSKLKKDALVDIIKGTTVIDEKSKIKEKWCLVRIAHPTEGFVKEYVPVSNVGRFSAK